MIKPSAEVRPATLQLFHYIREPVWLHLRSNCHSFAAMDCNAQCSEIFQLKTFNNISATEMHLLVSSVLFETMCVKKKPDIFVTYISMHDLLSSGFPPSKWYQYIIHRISDSRKLYCNSCSKISDSEVIGTLIPGKVLFIEFSIVQWPL